MNYNKIKLFVLIMALASLSYSTCYASDLREDTIDKSTPAQQSSYTEDQIHALQIVMSQFKRKELLNCRSVSKSFIKAADFVLFKSGLTQPIVRIRMGDKSDFEQLLSHGLEYTIPNITIHCDYDYDYDYDYNHDRLITEMQFRRFFNTRFSIMQSLRIDWANYDALVDYKFDPLPFNIVLSLSKALTRLGSIQALELHSCKISDKGMTELAPAISNNRTLKKLSFASVNPFFMQKNVAKILFTSLQTQSCLEELDLSGSELGYRDMYALCDLLTTDNSLEKLILNNTKLKLENKAFKKKFLVDAPFTKALEINKTLKFLDITFNPEEDMDSTEDRVEFNGKRVSLSLLSAENYFAPANFPNSTLKYNAEDLKKALMGIINIKEAQNIDFEIKCINLVLLTSKKPKK